MGPAPGLSPEPRFGAGFSAKLVLAVASEFVVIC